MNPFSRYLSQWSHDRALRQFVDLWDELERLIIQIYKGGQATPTNEDRYARMRTEATTQYSALAARLAPLWQQAIVAGHPATEDPFLRLLRTERAQDFVGDWEALQNLPAAREALNRALLAD